MCGLVGLWSFGGLSADDHQQIAAMTSTLRHRGPDDSGLWLDASAGIALGHRRLAIVDLSQAGHQPMASASGRYMIAYNGEIYNAPELRAELERIRPRAWRGHSDTEVLLAAIDEWGLEATLQRTNGMFAIALWDCEQRRLYLARDRFGEKPLYYGQVRGTLLFGSELKALAQHAAFDRTIDRDALVGFVRYSYIPAPASIWKGITKLPPASLIEFAADGSTSGPRVYWDAAAVARRGLSNPLTGDVVKTVEAALMRAVKMRMQADVPLGAFLSGGIDSSLIVALMQAQSSAAVKTFTIGFHDQSYNEATHAAAVARHLGTDHTELYLDPGGALDLVPQLSTIWDEPFADASQLPTLLVSQLARRHVTVSLSGDGGDEIFAGYNRYVLAPRIFQAARRLPMRRQIAALMRSRYGQALAERIIAAVPANRRPLGLKDRLPRLASILEQNRLSDVYRALVSQQSDPQHLVIGGTDRLGQITTTLGEPVSDMMLADMLTYLPDDILTKVDRATMAVSLEARVPFLDPDVAELGSRIPRNWQIRDGKGKFVLREILYKHVPRALIDRPKAGFGAPFGQWLNGPLRDWAEDLLDPSRMRQEGYLHVEPIQTIWRLHLSGTRQLQHQIWPILMFQSWLREWQR